MIGPADIEDLILDYAASNTRAVDQEDPEARPNQLIGGAWWTCPMMLLAFEAQKVVELRLVRLAWGGVRAETR